MEEQLKAGGHRRRQPPSVPPAVDLRISATGSSCATEFREPKRQSSMSNARRGGTLSSRLGPLLAWRNRKDLESVSNRLPTEFSTDPVAQSREFLAAELDSTTGLHADHAVARLAAVE